MEILKVIYCECSKTAPWPLGLIAAIALALSGTKPFPAESIPFAGIGSCIDQQGRDPMTLSTRPP